MRFRKMHGLGNDFIILDQKDLPESLTHDQIVQICDRHLGVGCDQLILLEPSQNADIFVRFYNSDGSESGACGNGTRCVAALVMKEIGQDECAVETAAGILPARMIGDLVEVDMGASAELKDLDLSIREADEPVYVDMGNPHCVFFVGDAESIDLANIGPVVEHHTIFPNRTNVEFVSLRGDGSLRVRVWERGAGITLACGSGACAVAAAALHRGLAGRNVELEMDGGVLSLEVRESDGHILMTGPVAYVFEGELKF